MASQHTLGQAFDLQNNKEGTFMYNEHSGEKYPRSTFYHLTCE
ncbi:MAG: hypothetical protein ACRCTJ_04400 [Brevinema sp.]